VPVGRSLPQNGPDPRWFLQEEFDTLSRMPKCISIIIRKCSAHASEMVGKVLLTHPPQLEWNQEMTSKPVTNFQTGDIIPKTVVQFQVKSNYRILLPEEEFEALFNILVSDFSLICELSNVTANSNFDGEVRKVALATIRLYRACRLETALCIELLRNELGKGLDPASLWRGNTYFTSVIEAMIRSSCSHFLVLSLKELVSEIATTAKEVSPAKVAQTVNDYVQQALCSLNNTADLFPKEMRFVLSEIRELTAQTWPDHPNLDLRVIANFLFLRYISAAVTSPVSHGLSQLGPTVPGQKILTQVAKTLQQAANFSPKGIDAQDAIQSETAELLRRLSSRPESFHPPTNQAVSSLKQLKRNPNSDGLHTLVVLTTLYLHFAALLRFLFRIIPYLLVNCIM